jgi:hypothetical protein
MVAAGATAHKIEAVIVIEAAIEKCPLAHKSALSFTVIGGWVQRYYQAIQA